MEDQNPDLPDGVKMMLRNDPEEAWKKVESAINAQKPKARQVFLSQTWVRVAASITLLICVGAMTYFLNFSGSRAHLIANNTTVNRSVVLPDSTVVYLHAHSEISYDDAYDDHRNVKMKGEAFFEVKRNAANPFRVAIGQSVVQVLGTSFNISDDTMKLDVTVATGKVSVETPAREVVYLEKGEMASYDKSAQKIRKIKNEDLNYNAWMTKLLTFRNTPLPQVFATLEEYFDVKITFDQRKASAISYTSDFEDPTLQDVLGEMKDVLNIDYKESGNNVIITIP